MKNVVVAALALLIAAPAISVPTVADAQVRTGSGAALRRAPQRPSLSDRELDRLYEAEDEVMELDGQIAEIQSAGEAAGGLTEAQQSELATLTRRRDAAQRTIDRLERKRNR